VIDRREILELAADLSLRPDVVEEDYALAWLLVGSIVPQNRQGSDTRAWR
jgi:hypothetical protein